MKKIVLLVGLMSGFGHHNLTAQFIGNKFEVNVSYGIVSPLETKDIIEGGFITPSLFRNFSEINGFSISGSFNYNSNYSMGVEWGKTEFNNWVNDKSVFFVNSTASLASVGPLLKLHTKFKQTGIQNKVELYTRIYPYLVFINTLIPKENVFITEPSNDLDPILQSNYSSFGTRISVGSTYAISQNIDLNFEIGGSYTKLESHLYNDKQLLSINTNVGVAFKLVKNKKYYL